MALDMAYVTVKCEPRQEKSLFRYYRKVTRLVANEPIERENRYLIHLID